MCTPVQFETFTCYFKYMVRIKITKKLCPKLEQQFRYAMKR